MALKLFFLQTRFVGISNLAIKLSNWYLSVKQSLCFELWTYSRVFPGVISSGSTQFRSLLILLEVVTDESNWPTLIFPFLKMLCSRIWGLSQSGLTWKLNSVLLVKLSGRTGIIWGESVPCASILIFKTWYNCKEPICNVSQMHLVRFLCCFAMGIFVIELKKNRKSFLLQRLGSQNQTLNQ